MVISSYGLDLVTYLLSGPEWFEKHMFMQKINLKLLWKYELLAG